MGDAFSVPFILCCLYGMCDSSNCRGRTWKVTSLNKQSQEVDKDNVPWKSPVITFKVTGPLSFKWNPPSVSRTALHSGLT